LKFADPIKEKEMTRPSSRWRVGAAVLAAASLAALAACSTPADSATKSDSSSGTVAQSATTAVTDYSKPVGTWPGPDEAVTSEPSRSITIMTCGSTGITCVRLANGAAAAAAALGWHADVVDGQNQPTVWNSALKTAIAQGTEGIVLAAVPPPAVAGALAVARAKGIPVVSLLNTDGIDLVTTGIDHDPQALGALLADTVAVQSHGDAHILLLEDDEFPVVGVRYQAFQTELAKACPDCTVVSKQQFSLALVSQRLAGTVSSTLTTNPDIDYVLQPFDAITPFTEQGIRAAGSKAQIIGVGADPPSVKAIGDGTEAASIGTPAEWIGWMGVDALVRTAAGVGLPKYEVPMRVITKDSVPGKDGWQGDFDYQAQFKKLWGV
jgi:ribose transport system substrate-binding protein